MIRQIFVVLCILFLFLLPTNEANTQENAEKQKSITIDLDASFALDGAGAYYFERSRFNGGFDTWINLRVYGNLGSSITYFADLGLALLYAEREYLGSWPIKVGSDEEVDVYSYPLAYFPYASYRSQWGGFVFPLTALNASGPVGWPDTTSIGFNLLCEIAGTALNDALLWHIGRTEHEAAGIVEGSSLVLNKAAQPFFGFDIQVKPFSWLQLYSLSGILEYYDSKGMTTSSATFQNAFSLTMLSVNYKQYIQFDVGSSVVWPKRFELAYLFPLTFPLLYQNNIGDFDNLAFFGNLKLQYPELGFLWFSLFIDEINFEGDFLHLDREMYAFQVGLRYLIPVLSSSSLTVSYTKIEPYCYTHQKTKTPWYGELMEEAYVNHGYGLGYYLPPNSDEIKVVFATTLSRSIDLNTQFQMIRHGAEYGDSMVYGSSYASELKGSGRNTDPALKKYFLHDGAYQWTYIVKAGAKWNLSKLPISFVGELGVVISYFTNIEAGKAKDGSSHPYFVIDTSEYPKSTGFIVNIGCKIVLDKLKEKISKLAKR
jgi:hypothetical protein